MKAPRFWYPPRGSAASPLLPNLMAPFSWAFQWGTSFRRSLARPYKSNVPVICIGNIVAGGAGKTPTAIALAGLLKKYGHKPVFVTRGYKGSESQRTPALFVDRAFHSAAEVGDEALLLAAVAPTWIGADRASAIREAEGYGSVIIMDDGLQNPAVTPSASLLVIDGEVGLGNGHIIPAGPLRETLVDALARVKAVLIIGESDSQELSKKIDIPLFRGRLKPQTTTGFPSQGKFIAFAGIGRPEKFYATARAYGLVLCETQDFPDHHVFSEGEIDLLRLRAEEFGARLLTTEKDAVRLPATFRAEVIVLPVTLAFEAAQAGDELAKLCLGLS